MTYDLKQQLRDLANCRHDDFTIGYEAADRIEQLERERAQLRKDVEMLRDAIKDALWDETWWRVKATEALAATEPKE